MSNTLEAQSDATEIAPPSTPLADQTALFEDEKSGKSLSSSDDSGPQRKEDGGNGLQETENDLPAS